MSPFHFAGLSYNIADSALLYNIMCAPKVELQYPKIENLVQSASKNLVTNYQLEKRKSRLRNYRAKYEQKQAILLSIDHIFFYLYKHPQTM